MQIKDMFVKDIERTISGVIKVGQDENENVKQELEEYVVTKEINKHLGKFYDNYLKSLDKPTDKIGVWISGFFGSGKSHFLKILSYLLENKIVDGKNAIEYFNDKVEDQVLLGDMKRATIPDTQVILFNIDAKSPMSGKSNEETLLKIFLKVFHNHQGFYGDNPGVAYMEKYLTAENKYETFKEEFKASSGHEWETRRRTFSFSRDHVVKALSKSMGISEESASEWYRNESKEFSIDIEGFAKEVKEYLHFRGKESRLIFLVDEVGQYVGEDNNLMLNLQTIAEELGSHCHGRAWIILTSQEAIDELSKRIRENDFSKIQGRFDTKLSLSSISVDEVIKKRILEKHDYVEQRLKQIYLEKSAILKNLINFEGAKADLTGYSDEDEFAAVYPFIPYQFKLLQNVFEQVRKHGSSGRHLSEGERSMLSAFKESAIQYKNEEEGILVPFHNFYEAIEEFLNSSITRVIEGAKRNPALKDDYFSINLLKTLFMVKYINEFPASVDNLAVLMTSKIEEDKILLKEKIINSLNALTKQHLIQKNGNVYIFLTDDEQDINKEIKLTNVEETTFKKELREYIFKQFYEAPKFRYSPYYDFDFNKKMDEIDHGRQTSDIGINLLSPLSTMYSMPEVNLRLDTKDKGEMIIRLGENSNYLEELEEVLRVNEYTKSLNMSELPEGKQLIINGKKSEERARRNRAVNSLEDALKNSTIFINGEKAEPKGSSVKEIINNAMKTLTDSVYTKLSYIEKNIQNVNELQDILNIDNTQISMDDSLVDHNKLAIREMEEYIKLENDMHKQIRLRPILEYFTRKPFGWNELDVLGLLVTLLKDQRINLKYQGTNLTTATNNTLPTITKTSEQDKVIITPRIAPDEDLLKRVKDIVLDLWNKTNLPDDEDGLALKLRELITSQLNEIDSYLERYEGRKYPGKSLLEKGQEYFEGLKEVIDNSTLFKKLEEMEKDLITWEEDMVYVKGFFNKQKGIFDNGLRVHKLYEENADYLNDEEVKEAYKNLSSILEDYLPYGKIKDIPIYVNIIDSKISYVLKDKKGESLKQIEDDLNYLDAISDHPGVKQSTKDGYRKIFEGLKNNIETEEEILKIEGIKARSSSFRTSYEQEIIKEKEIYTPPGTTPDTPPEERPTKQIKIKDLTKIKTIKTEAAIDVFLKELEKILKEELKNHNIEFID